MNLFSSCYFLSPWLFKVLDIISPFRLGPSGRTCSKQKTVEEFVERERERERERRVKASFLLLSFMTFPYSGCCSIVSPFFSLLMNSLPLFVV